MNTQRATIWREEFRLDARELAVHRPQAIAIRDIDLVADFTAPSLGSGPCMIRRTLWRFWSMSASVTIEIAADLERPQRGRTVVVAGDTG
jgi:hypothetical protein